jgi:hypothetical protein
MDNVSKKYYSGIKKIVKNHDAEAERFVVFLEDISVQELCNVLSRAVFPQILGL